MTKATETVLGELHKKLAEHMINSMNTGNSAAVLLTKYPDLPLEIQDFLDKAATPNPAFMTACAKFLKDNQITVDPEESGELSDLEQLIKNKQLKTKPVSSIPLHDTIN